MNINTVNIVFSSIRIVISRNIFRNIYDALADIRDTENKDTIIKNTESFGEKVIGGEGANNPMNLIIYPKARYERSRPKKKTTPYTEIRNKLNSLISIDSSTIYLVD